MKRVGVLKKRYTLSSKSCPLRRRICYRFVNGEPVLKCLHFKEWRKVREDRIVIDCDLKRGDV